MNSTDPRVKRTMELIDQALVEALSTMPSKKVTVQRICTLAGVNRSTFYTYYKDKIDLMESFLARTLAAFRDSLDASFIKAPLNRIKDPTYMENFRFSLKQMQSKKRLYQALWAMEDEQDIYREMLYIVRERILESITEDGLLTEQNRKYCELYAYLLASNMMTLVSWWFSHYDEVPLEQIVDIMAENMQKGLFSTFKKLL